MLYARLAPAPFRFLLRIAAISLLAIVFVAAAAPGGPATAGALTVPDVQSNIFTDPDQPQANGPIPRIKEKQERFAKCGELWVDISFYNPYYIMREVAATAPAISRTLGAKRY